MDKKISYKHICCEDTYMFNYTQLPDELFTIKIFDDLSLEAKVLYSFMLRRVSISKENKWLDENGDVYIYYRTDEIMSRFNCSNKTASKILSELEEIGLIDKIRQGQGKPDIIYVNKFYMAEEDPAINSEDMTVEIPMQDVEIQQKNTTQGDTFSEVKKVHIKKCKNYTSKSEKNTLLEVKKLHTNYKENNYKDIAISSSVQNSSKIANGEGVRLLEEEKEDLKEKIKYNQTAQKYSVQIAEAVLQELLRRDRKYLDVFSANMFMKICKAIRDSREPILNLPGFINWCLDRINNIQSQRAGREVSRAAFNTMLHTNYDYAALERELISN